MNTINMDHIKELPEKFCPIMAKLTKEEKVLVISTTTAYAALAMAVYFSPHLDEIATEAAKIAEQIITPPTERAMAI